MRAAFVLFALSALAQAEDELYQTVWIVGQDGELLGWPDPVAGDVGLSQGDLKPFRVFESGPDACLRPLCCWGVGLLLVPGPSDLASLCDPERHLRKTNQNVFDEWLLMSVVPGALAQARTDPTRRRVFLDALLGWRVLGERRLKEAAPMVRGVAETELLDPITRRAAADIAAELEERSPAMPDLPARPVRPVGWT